MGEKGWSTDLGFETETPTHFTKTVVATGICRASRIFVWLTMLWCQIWLHSIVLYTWPTLGIYYLLCPSL